MYVVCHVNPFTLSMGGLHSNTLSETRRVLWALLKYIMNAYIALTFPDRAVHAINPLETYIREEIDDKK